MILLVVGVDGADFERVLTMDLPHIKFRGDIEHVRIIESYLSSMQSWSSMITGKPVNEHGMKDMTPTYTSDKVKVKRIWEMEKYRFGVLGIPGLWPPTPINGWMVTGKLTPTGSIYTYPPDLASELDGLGYRVEVTVPEAKLAGAGADSLEGLDKGAVERELDEVIVPKTTECLIHLQKTRPVDVCFAVYSALDWVQHLFMHDEGKVRWWYRRMDEEVGRLSDALRPEEKIVVSDHGFTLYSPVFRPRNFTGAHRGKAILVSSQPIPDNFNHVICVFYLMADALRQREKPVERRLKALGYID